MIKLKRKRKVPFIEQIENVECGLACIAMILNYYQIKKSMTELRESFPASRDGFSFYHLSEISSYYGLSASAYKLEAEQIEKNITLPSIIQWGHSHFVVLEGVRNGKFLIVDPNEGRASLPLSEFKDKYSGFILQLKLDGNLPEISTTKEKESGFVGKYVKMNKMMLIKVILIALVIQAIMVMVPLSTKWVTDHALASSDVSELNTFGFLLLLFAGGFLITSLLRGYLIAVLQKKLDSAILKDFMKKLYDLPYSFFENRSSGDLLHRANSSFFIRDIISSTMITIFIDLLLIVTYTTVMMSFSVHLSLIMFSLCLCLAGFLLINAKLIRDMNKKNINKRVKTQSILTENLYNIVDVKSMGLEKSRLNLWSEKYEEELTSSKQLNIFTSYIGTVTSLFQVAIPLVILWLGGYQYIKGNISLGTLIAFNSIAASYIAPVISISNNYTHLLSLSSYFSRMKDVLYSKSEQEGVSKYQDSKVQGDIRFKGVSFSYNPFSECTLKNLDIEIKQGEKVAIVGPSGSGKSSITKLLLGLYKIDNGLLTIGGKNIEDYNIHALRGSIGTVLQESKLFSGTIGENISMGREIDHNKLLDAAKKAGIIDEIFKSPMAFETMISESGNNFSGGQRQRLLIARALYQEPTMIIFDEATSNLDSFTENHISNTLRNLNITQIIIAHRLNTIKNADKIFYLRDGEVKEAGTHDQLMDSNGEYFQLYSDHNERKAAAISS
ncbi:peptidase domain-containing ABC transporter [Rossellomorea vietnamensis]|uniref:peptidase domain-containing ABC transporter n=1 Tax=Rossellomorea vietnamensis TaxID=218284 RepID=UPI003CF298C8